MDSFKLRILFSRSKKLIALDKLIFDLNKNGAQCWGLQLATSLMLAWEAQRRKACYTKWR